VAYSCCHITYPFHKLKSTFNVDCSQGPDIGKCRLETSQKVPLSPLQGYYESAAPTPGVNFENFTDVKFRDILLSGTGHRDRRLKRDSSGQARTYGGSNLNQNIKSISKSNFRFIRERSFAISSFQQKCRFFSQRDSSRVIDSSHAITDKHQVWQVMTCNGCMSIFHVMTYVTIKYMSKLHFELQKTRSMWHLSTPRDLCSNFQRKNRERLTKSLVAAVQQNGFQTDYKQ